MLDKERIVQSHMECWDPSVRLLSVLDQRHVGPWIAL